MSLIPATITNWAIAMLGNVQDCGSAISTRGRKARNVNSVAILTHSYRNRTTPPTVLENIKNKIFEIQIILVMLNCHSNYGLINAAAETSYLYMRTQYVNDMNVNDGRKFNGTFMWNLLLKMDTELGNINNCTVGPRPWVMQTIHVRWHQRQPSWTRWIN